MVWWASLASTSSVNRDPRRDCAMNSDVRLIPIPAEYIEIASEVRISDAAPMTLTEAHSPACLRNYRVRSPGGAWSDPGTANVPSIQACPD